MREQVAGGKIYMKGNSRQNNAGGYEKEMIRYDNENERPPGSGVPSYADCP